MSYVQQWPKGQFYFAAENDARCALTTMFAPRDIAHAFSLLASSYFRLILKADRNIWKNMTELIQYVDKYEVVSLHLELLTTGGSYDAIFHIYAIKYR
jgi:hypothetical protein